MTLSRVTGAALAAAFMLAAPAVQAAVVGIDPTFDRFGALPQATFGGSGIPNDSVAITEVDLEAAGTLTLGITATPRFSAGGPVTNDGAGTFTAPAGRQTPAGSSTPGALWNFSYFAGISGGDGSIELGDIGLEVLYDFDPSVDNVEIDLGVLQPGFFGFTGQYEGSQNLDFGFLETTVPGFIQAPTGPDFDPLVGGEYTFVIRSTAFGGQTSINVNVPGTSPIPLPASALLLLAGLGGLGALSRRRG